MLEAGAPTGWNFPRRMLCCSCPGSTSTDCNKETVDVSYTNPVQSPLCNGLMALEKLDVEYVVLKIDVIRSIESDPPSLGPSVSCKARLSIRLVLPCTVSLPIA